MKSDKRLMAEITDLVIHSLNGTLNEEQLHHLENLLVNNPLAVEYYTEILTVHTSLDTIEGIAGLINTGNANINDDLWTNLLQQERTHPSIELEQAQSEPIIEQKPSTSDNNINRCGKLSLIAAFISIASLISFVIIGQKSLKPLVPHAEIISSYEVEWHKPLFDYKAGDKISDNIINIKKGLLKLEMNDGTDVVLQGPCLFSLESDSQIHLTQGKLTASVPEKAIGFTIRTPSASIVDYGTEFAVSVDKYANTEAHVSKGEVELRLGSDKYHFSESLRLIKNQAGQTSGKILKSIPVSLNKFSYDTPTKFETKVKSLDGSNLYIKPLNDNPISITEIISNNNTFTINPSISITSGPKSKKYSKSFAIQFDGPQTMLGFDSLPISSQSENGSYSVGFWLKLNKNGQQVISHGYVKGVRKYHRLFTITKDNKLQHCAFDTNNGARWRIAESDIPLKRDIWYFVMVVRNMKNDSKRLYINGELSGDNTVEKVQEAKAIAGFSTLNFGGDIGKLKGFDGALSDIMMFSRALKEKEVRELYRSALN